MANSKPFTLPGMPGELVMSIKEEDVKVFWTRKLNGKPELAFRRYNGKWIYQLPVEGVWPDTLENIFKEMRNG